MFPHRPEPGKLRQVAPRLTLAVALAGLAAAPALAESAPALLPGRLTGAIAPYVVQKGDTVVAIAARHTVHPVRVYRPNAQALRQGLIYGRTIHVDQRRVTPTFAPGTSGVVLNVPEAHVYLLDRGKLVQDYPVAVSLKDWPVPIGQTRVVSKSKNPTWHVPKSIQQEMRENGREVKTRVPPGPDNPLGSRWIGIWDGSFGLHGTIVPSSIKRYASHGCVRFLRPHIEDLYDRVKLGTPVTVAYQPVLLAAEGPAIWLSAYPDHYERDYDYRASVTALARRAGVLPRLNWKAVEEVIRVRDGILVDVALQPAATPTPMPTPTPTPRPTPTPSPTPIEGVPLPETTPEPAELYGPPPPAR